MVQEETPFKDMSYLELWRPSYSVEQNIFCNLKGGIIKNIHVKIYEIWTSGSGGDISGALAALLLSAAEPFVQFW